MLGTRREACRRQMPITVTRGIPTLKNLMVHRLRCNPTPIGGSSDRQAKLPCRILVLMSENKRVAKRPVRWMVAFLWALGGCALALVLWFASRPESPV